MSNIIDSIQLSGTVYTIQGTGGGGSPTVELTQAEYDALVSAGTVSADTYYIITDATPADISQYWTSAQTQSAITSAVSTKQDALVSGTNIKTINNESILGSGNIDIQGGGGLDSDTERLLSTALVDLNDRKIDASEVKSNYQLKGDYATKSELAAKANASEVMTLEKANENELVTATALNDLNERFGGLKIVKITESEYAALTTKDENTLYVVVADPS